MLTTCLKLFSRHWRTYFFWTFGLITLHGIFVCLNANGIELKNMIPDTFGGDGFVSVVVKVYGGFYALGMPLILTLFDKKLSTLKSQTARDYIVHNSEVIFFIVVTPVFIIYSISILYFYQHSDVHTLLLYLLICYSIFRLYRLADFCLAVSSDLSGLLNREFKNRFNEIFEEI